MHFPMEFRNLEVWGLINRYPRQRHDAPTTQNHWWFVRLHGKLLVVSLFRTLPNSYSVVLLPPPSSRYSRITLFLLRRDFANISCVFGVPDFPTLREAMATPTYDCACMAHDHHPLDIPEATCSCYDETLHKPCVFFDAPEFPDRWETMHTADIRWSLERARTSIGCVGHSFPIGSGTSEISKKHEVWAKLWCSKHRVRPAAVRTRLG